jgi:4-amino-4-deoxy-L-arabinose transferase-like glycosyltransferase
MFRKTAFHIGCLALLCGIMFFFQLARRPLWDMDEAMHAVVAKAMVERGDWVTPRFNGAPFSDKPVLHYWLVAATFALLGFTELAARLPSALLGTGLVFMTYGFGRRMLGAEKAFWGALFLATNLEITVLSRTVVHDSSLAFFVALALFLFWRGWTEPRGRLACYLGAYAAVGFATLAKGPVGIVLPAIAVWAFLAARGQVMQTLRQSRLWAGIAIVLAIALPRGGFGAASA